MFDREAHRRRTAGGPLVDQYPYGRQSCRRDPRASHQVIRPAAAIFMSQSLPRAPAISGTTTPTIATLLDPAPLVGASACPVALLVGDLTLAERYIKALMDLSARHALELWNLAGRCFEGVLLVKRGEIGTGLELLRTAFSRMPQNAFILLYTLFLGE